MENWEEGGRRMERENIENEWKEMRLVGGGSGSVWAKVKKNRRRKWRRMGKKICLPKWREVGSLKKKKK